MTSARVAHLLRQNGFNAFVIEGGFQAWRRSGKPVEPVPAEEMLVLPQFR